MAKTTTIPMMPSDDDSDNPTLDWGDFDQEGDAILDAEAAITGQTFNRTHKKADGVDEYGPYEVLPISMIRGAATHDAKVHKVPMKHMVLEFQDHNPRGWYKSKKERPGGRPRSCYTEALLTTPYGGFCPTGCSFCYLNNGVRGYRATGLPTVDPHYPDKFAEKLKNCNIAGIGYITSFTEPFHRLEPTYHITERLSKVILDSGLPLFYCTRRIPPEWAVDNLQANPYNYIQWSVNTPSQDDYRKLSPGAAKLEDIFNMVARLSALGVYTSWQVNPIHPGITTLDELFELIQIAKQLGLRHMIFKFYEHVSSGGLANPRQLLLNRMRARRMGDDRIEAFNTLLNQDVGGVLTIQQDVRIEWLNELLGATREAGITMSTCYEYYSAGKGKSKSGASLGPWYTTADACHGRGVPLHYRPEPGALFQPFPCYRKGCLNCEDYGTRACGNPTLIDATALRYKDMRDIRLTEPDGGWDWNAPDSCVHPTQAADDPACNPEYMTDAELWGWEWSL